MMGYYERLGWIDEYVPRIAPYIHVRGVDRLLIKIPNEAYKLNPQGIKILQHLLQGKSIYTIVDNYQEKEHVAHDLHDFFCDLRAALKGCYREGDRRRTVEKIEFTLPYNTLPVLSEVALTYRCNLTCRFCYAGCGSRGLSRSKEMDSNEVKRVLALIKNEAEVPAVSFTGGEPTLREDLTELVGFAKTLGLWVNLITNGTLVTARLATELKNAGLDSAQVSLEAGTAQWHDRIAGKPGAFAETLRGLEYFRNAGIRVHTNTTISRLNCDGLNSIVDLVKEHGMDKLSMNLLMPAGRALTELNDILVTYSEIGKIVLDVAAHARRQGIEFMWYSPTPICIFNPIVHGLGNKGCAACDGLLSVAPNGDILPCSSYAEPQGNLLELEGRFQEHWQSERIDYFKSKRFAHPYCRACEHLAICNGGCPLYWQQVGYDEIPAICNAGCIVDPENETVC